eukprot:Anaeramoba_ignava/a347959_4.p1 GENE.a347959_4~~a347959_4.p1  ORF type:complete len:191 (-),score=8.84 a347959_4:83-655(-)
MKILKLIYKSFYNLNKKKQTLKSSSRKGMAIPLVFGLIVVSGVLGTTIWMSSRIGNRRINKITERLQLENTAEAGITSGFSRLKLELTKGLPLKKVKIRPIQQQFQLTEGTGTCNVTVKLVEKNEFLIISRGKYQAKKNKQRKSKIMKIQAKVKVVVTLIENYYGRPRYLKNYSCSLKIINREILSQKDI